MATVDIRAEDGVGGDESGAWIEFASQCHATWRRLEEGSVEPRAASSLVEAASKLRTPTARVLALTLITRITGKLAETSAMSVTSAPGVSRPEDDKVNARASLVLAYIDEHHSRSTCRLEQIARTLLVSRSYLSRLVQRETGTTFNRHLQFARMNTAARLLQSSRLSVKEVSSATGYGHVPSFDRQFRKHFRMTPGEFRRGLRI